MDSLDARLALLERRHRRLQRVTLGLGAALLLATGALALRGPSTHALRVRALELVDAQGRVQAALRTGPAGAGELVLLDGQGAPRLRVGLGGDGSPQVRLAGSAGQALADLSVYGAEGVRLSLSTPQGTDFFTLGSLADGSARLALADSLGRSRVVLGAGSGAPGLELLDRLGSPRARLGLEAGDAPQLVLQGKDGNLFQAPF